MNAALRLAPAGVLAAALLAAGRPAADARTPASAPATAPAPAGRIVFSSNRSGPWRIWTIRPDGSGMRQLTRARPGEHDVDPAGSRDGKRIVFTSTRGGSTGVWQMRIAAARAERICDGDQAELSPDGRRIAFRRAGRIVIRELAGGKERPVTPAGWSNCSGPAWSPDGRTLAFARLARGANAIFTVPAGGGEPRKVYGKRGACEPHFSPDGKRIVYETETHVCTIRPDGSDNRPVTYYGGVQRFGRYSPDGKRIVFCQAPSPRGPWELYVVAAGGGTPRKLTDGGSDMYPHWR